MSDYESAFARYDHYERRTPSSLIRQLVIIWLELCAVVFIGAGIASYAGTNERVVLAANLGGIAMAALFMVTILLYLRIRYNVIIGTMADAISGAAVELIKLMENSGPGGAEGRARRAEDTTERFGVNGAALLTLAGRAPALIAGHRDHKLAEAGMHLMRQYWDDAAKFRKGRGMVRTGVLIFLTIVKHDNLQAAHTLMTEYMKRQQIDWEGFPNLKIFLSIPTEVNACSGAETLQRNGLTWRQYYIATTGLRRAKRNMINSLEYRAPAVDGRPSVRLEGEAVLKAMREFVRSDDTAQAITESTP